MRKSKQEAARTRQRIVQTAAQEFRRNGIVATGLADVMSAAGLTHGGFYKHFASKNQLVAEACAVAVGSSTETITAAGMGTAAKRGLAATVAAYLSTAHRDNPSGGCVLAALGSEIARCDEMARAAATEGFLRFVEIIARQYRRTPPAVARKRAIAAVSTMIGALVLSRIVTDPELSAEILQEAEKCVTRG